MRQRTEAHQIQQRKNKANAKYEKLKLIDPNSKKTNKAKVERDTVNKSKYGVTNKQINKEANRRKIASYGLQTASMTSLLATGAAITHPVLSIIGALAIDAASIAYRKKIGKKAVKMMIDNMDDSKSNKN